MKTKTKLMVDISKNIVMQYLYNLENSIQYYEKILNQNKEEMKYQYECHVERAKTQVENVKKILANYDSSIFDGAILENETLVTKYGPNGKNYNIIKNMPNTTKEQLEFEFTKEGIERIFEAICINPECLNYALYASMQMISGEKIIDETEINRATEETQYGAAVPADIFGYTCTAGKVKINNVLTMDVTADTGILKSEINKPVIYEQTQNLLIDSRPIHKIIESYLKEKLFSDITEWRKSENYINGLYEQGYEVEHLDENSLKEFINDKKQKNVQETYELLSNMRISELLTWYKEKYDSNLKNSWEPYIDPKKNNSL